MLRADVGEVSNELRDDESLYLDVASNCITPWKAQQQFVGRSRTAEYFDMASTGDAPIGGLLAGQPAPVADDESKKCKMFADRRTRVLAPRSRERIHAAVEARTAPESA